MIQDPKRYTITAALPYTNGPIHIGHLAGVYVPSDIYARYLRMQGKDVAFMCGSDEHGVAISMKAKKEGITPQEVIDKYDGIIRQSFIDFGISFDNYSRTSAKIHHETASEFFKTLNEKGELLNVGEVILVFINKKTGKPCFAPDVIMNKIEEKLL